MDQETVTYLTNITIGAILAVLMTHHWWRHRDEESGAMGYWVLAAWIMTAADVLFAARPLLPYAAGRLLPTLGVTIGQAVLLAGAQRTAGLPVRRSLLAVFVGLHAAALTLMLLVAELAEWRMVVNGLVWGGLSVVSAVCLRRGAPPFWRSFAAPATIFLVHAAFHGFRLVLALVFRWLDAVPAGQLLQLLGDIEVSFFMVALFVGLLLAHLRMWHDHWLGVQAELHTLTGLMPICAWCKKVRDDDGYWQQVEEYISQHSRLKFTHGVCNSCLEEMREREKLPR